MRASDCEVCSSLPFMETPEWGNIAMPEQRLRQVWHCCDLVKLMDRILIAVVVDDKGEDRLRRGGHTRAHAMALKAGITWYCNVAGMTRGQRCEGTERSLLEAAAGPGAEAECQ